MIALAGGIVALVVGIILITIWFSLFLKALAAGVPIMLILGGALAAYLGIEELKDKRATDQFEPEPDNLKDEVETLKEENKRLKDEKKDEVKKEDKPAPAK